MRAFHAYTSKNQAVAVRHHESSSHISPYICISTYCHASDLRLLAKLSRTLTLYGRVPRMLMLMLKQATRHRLADTPRFFASVRS